MPISKFLIHWTGKDLVKRKVVENLPDDWLVREYAKRLKDNYQNGLFTERKKEKDVLRGLAIDSLVRLCFSEIRLSQAQIHAKRYGELGIGFSRDFVAAKGGRRVLYIPNEPKGGLLEQRFGKPFATMERLGRPAIPPFRVLAGDAQETVSTVHCEAQAPYRHPLLRKKPLLLDLVSPE